MDSSQKIQEGILSHSNRPHENDRLVLIISIRPRLTIFQTLNTPKEEHKLRNQDKNVISESQSASMFGDMYIDLHLSV